MVWEGGAWCGEEEHGVGGRSMVWGGGAWCGEEEHGGEEEHCVGRRSMEQAGGRSFVVGGSGIVWVQRGGMGKEGGALPPY